MRIQVRLLLRFCLDVLGELKSVTSFGRFAFHNGSALRWACVDSRSVRDLDSGRWRVRAA